MSEQPRLEQIFGCINIGSFRIAAMVAGLTEDGDVLVLGSHHRQAQGIKRGYVTDMAAATYAVREAMERAEKIAGQNVRKVHIGASGAGLASNIAQVEIEIGGRRIEVEDIERLLLDAREGLEPDGRMVLHAQPAHYTLDGAHGVANPKGLHAERLGVDVHVMLADGAPIRNITETVQNAHLEVSSVVGSPVAAGLACLSEEERELGVALVEFGAQVTNVSVFAAGMLLGLKSIPVGSADMTDAIASVFGIKRFQAERLKCRYGSAVASPSDHREMIPVDGPGDPRSGEPARGADDKGRIARAELIAVIADELDRVLKDVDKALKSMGFAGARGQQVVITGGGAELSGIADYAQGSLGCPVRIGKPPELAGLAEAHRTPAFATLAGLALYAARDPVDIRVLKAREAQQDVIGFPAIAGRVWRAMREYF